MRVVKELFKFLLLASAIISCSTMTLMVNDFDDLNDDQKKNAIQTLKDENGALRVPATTYKRQQTKYKTN